MNLSGSLLDYLIAFSGGVLMSFTPCVYPLIPISAGYIGIRAAESKLKGLGLSLAYVTGLAVTYSVLGLVASLTGTLFGKFSSSPLSNFLAGALIILLGFSLLDLFSMPLPNIIKLPALKKRGYFSAFFLGLISGLIASPCLTPVLGAILVYLAARKNLLYGASLLFTFAYGMGLVLILIGTFSAALLKLPKSGKWMVYIKKACAFILIGAGVYFIFIAIRRM
jgi:thiol:disulfide interchange protein DsbD